jgi:hypothetical protein
VKQNFAARKVTTKRRVKIFVEMRAGCALFSSIPSLPPVNAGLFSFRLPAAARRAP